MNDKIQVNPGRKATTTGESIENALAEAGIVLDSAPIIYMPQKRQNGVYWLALGKRDGAAIAIHGAERHTILLTSLALDLNQRARLPVTRPVIRLSLIWRQTWRTITMISSD